jgi:hypothetical protein
MSVEEAYAPVIHTHNNCPICNSVALIEDIPAPRNHWDKLMITIRNMDATVRIMTGKRIEVREVK